jgi:Zn-dependent protease
LSAARVTGASVIDTAQLIQYLFFMVVFLFSLSVHEAAHAKTAEWFGDPTARYLGRVTLNPIPHIDLVGTLIFPTLAFFSGALLFGWAKPVPWNPLLVRDRRKADIWISAAGPISNLLLLAVFLLAIKGLQSYHMAGGAISGTVLEPLLEMCVLGAFLNTALAVFNMVPIPPLDGSWILPHFLPRDLAEAYQRIRPYGFIILLGCLYLGVLGAVLSPFMEIVRRIIAA